MSFRDDLSETSDVVILGAPLFNLYYVIMDFDNNRLAMSGLHKTIDSKPNPPPTWVVIIIIGGLLALVGGGLLCVINQRKKLLRQQLRGSSYN